GLSLVSHVEEIGRSLGVELLEPTRIYTADLLALLRDARTRGAVRALSHVAGGGMAEHLARVMSPGPAGRIDGARWEPGAVFSRVAHWGAVPQLDLEGTLNMGIGMVALVAQDQADAALALLAERGLGARAIGEVVDGEALPAAGTALEHVV